MAVKCSRLPCFHKHSCAVWKSLVDTLQCYSILFCSFTPRETGFCGYNVQWRHMLSSLSGIGCNTHMKKTEQWMEAAEFIEAVRRR